MAVVCGGAAFAFGLTPAVALTGAALAAMVRVLAGDSPAALAAAVVAPLLALATFAEAGGIAMRHALALAAAGLTVNELARLSDPASAPVRLPSPVVAALSAITAAILDPSFVALVAITGVRLMTVRGAIAPRSRWAVAVASTGLVALALAVIGGTLWPALGGWWYGAPAHLATPRTLAALMMSTLGPITAVAALAGVASLARMRHVELAIAAVIASAVLVDLRAGAPQPATIGLAAVLAGVAIARLSAMIRIPSAQAITGATIGALLVLPPAWIALERRALAAPPVTQIEALAGGHATSGH
jgi:hypothetical protein